MSESSFETDSYNIETDDSDVSEEAVYEPERIIGSRKEKGVIQYLVKWKGFQKSDATWENSSGISRPELIEEYVQRKLDKKNKSSSQTEKKESKSKKSSKSSKSSKSEKKADDAQEVQPKSIIDSFIKKGKSGKMKIYYIVLMEDETEVQYSSKKVRSNIPELGITFLESFSRN